jgi:hypothetical protein
MVVSLLGELVEESDHESAGGAGEVAGVEGGGDDVVGWRVLVGHGGPPF